MASVSRNWRGFSPPRADQREFGLWPAEGFCRYL